MEYVIAIFLLGLLVTFVVAKGVMMSHELAAAELEKELREESPPAGAGPQPSSLGRPFFRSLSRPVPGKKSGCERLPGYFLFCCSCRWLGRR